MSKNVTENNFQHLEKLINMYKKDFQCYFKTEIIIIVGNNNFSEKLVSILKETGNFTVLHITTFSSINKQYANSSKTTIVFSSISEYNYCPYKNKALINNILNSIYLRNESSTNDEVLNNILNTSLNKFENICIAGTPYGLLLYLLYNGSIKKTLFVFYGNYPLNYSANILRKHGAICLFLSYDEHREYESAVNNDIVNVLAQINDKKFKIFGQDTVPTILQFINKNLTLFEDGKISYISKEEAAKKKGFEVYVHLDEIESIVFAGIDNIPESLKSKAIIAKLDTCWSKKNDAEKEEILNIFGFEKQSFKKLINSGRDILVVTRNYSKVGKCSVENHIAMYEELINNYDENKIIIKPHPNDNVNYSEIFKKCIVLPKEIPAEFFQLCDIPLKKIVSVDDSSNIFGFFNIDSKIEFHQELLKKYKVIRKRDDNKGDSHE